MPGNGSDLIRKHNDFVLILIFSAVALIASLAVRSGRREGSLACVRIDGMEYGNYSLEEDQKVIIHGKDFVSTLVIHEGMADMTEADCPDQICVNHRPVRFRGETIVCLPHKLVVEILSDREDSPGGVDAISR